MSFASNAKLADQAKTFEVIAWIARQSWCTGKVGMFGISWGGFNALQVAARKPPALKAIVTLCSTDDRYEDDIHYKGGTLLNENLGWAATMLAYSSRPPDPKIVAIRVHPPPARLRPQTCRGRGSRLRPGNRG